MPQLEAIVNIADFSLSVSRNERVTHAREHLDQLFDDKYPEHFQKEHVRYHKDEPEELAIINYTSGTTGFSKGVMLPYRAVWSNVDIAIDVIGPYVEPGSNMVSLLPMAHMYGLAFEFLFPFCYGIHLFFLCRLPSPSIMAQAFADIQPSLIIAVPMIVEKIIRKRPTIWMVHQVVTAAAACVQSICTSMRTAPSSSFRSHKRVSAINCLQ